MENIIALNIRKTFTLSEARTLLPLIYRVTDESAREVKVLVNQLKALGDKPSLRAQQIEGEINVIVEKWNQKIQKLGANPKGLWLADFDHGQGFYCWKYPETDICFGHGYNEGYTGRTPLDN